MICFTVDIRLLIAQQIVLHDGESSPSWSLNSLINPFELFVYVHFLCSSFCTSLYPLLDPFMFPCMRAVPSFSPIPPGIKAFHHQEHPSKNHHYLFFLNYLKFKVFLPLQTSVQEPLGFLLHHVILSISMISSLQSNLWCCQH